MASSAKEPTHAYYKARRKYHLFRTCNTWVALALKEAGLNVRSFLVLTSGQLFRQLNSMRGIPCGASHAGHPMRGIPCGASHAEHPRPTH